MIFRLSGPVELADVRSGTAKTGKAYSIPFAIIRLSDFAATEVNLADVMVGKITTGDVVDLIVDVEQRSGYLSARAIAFWPKDPTVTVAGALHSAKAI